MKYVILDSQHLPNGDFSICKNILESHGIEFVNAQCKTVEEVVAVAKDADAIASIYFKLTPEVLKQLPNCKVLLRHGIGYDNIDVDAATALKIPVCNVPDYCTEEVAMHALGLLLDAMRKIAFFDRQARKGTWDPTLGYNAHRPSKTTLGLIAFGKIARQLAVYAKAMGMTVIAYDEYLPDAAFEQAGVEKVSLDELFSRSDAISVHAPLTKETFHIIDKAALSKMKDGVILVNTSRGPLICLDDLVAALKSGKVLAAGLDVFEGEPVTDTTHEMYSCENLTITPHAAFNSIEALPEQFEKIALTAVRVLNGELPYNVVNKAALAKK